MKKYYDSFIAFSNTPFNEFHSFQQELINEDFECSPTWHQDIEQEIEFGSLKFKKIDARINQIMDSKVGDRINDDYRKIIFRDLNFKPELGSRFKFDNNVWIVYSTDNIKSVHSSCYIRRCNNTINIQDKYGNIHQEPCIIDIKPTKSGIIEQEYMSIPIARQVLMYQLNDWTKTLFINSRIMFNRQTYKIGAIMELDRTETFNPESIKFVKCYLDDDLTNEYDNEELQVADYKTYNYSIRVIKDLIGIKGQTGVLESSVYLNDEEKQEKINWYSSNENIITINKETGSYEMLNSGNAIIYAKMANNENFCEEVNVEISEQQLNVYKNIINPSVDYIPLNNVQNYEVYETLNGNKTNTKFEISLSGMKEKYYSFSENGNEFSIKNILQNETNLLRVSCKNLRDDSIIELEIELGGLF